ncbi:hypothetical protein [Ruegeria arenilitoris]|uniref:hypothetical protein n=1 Tax=Ruegeria arenilitoris TaxID=1173585 RepID=UPI001C939167|nr:hypothetical protein [Ruegeria arenilitoris]MBY6081843.1 hypothetical protein [Ruegeria arenilitoris]
MLSRELSLEMKDWPSPYHLHHQRCNIFSSVAGRKDGPILKIGAGGGILTRFLGEEGNQTFALVGSSRRASIIGERCRDLDMFTWLIRIFRILAWHQVQNNHSNWRSGICPRLFHGWFRNRSCKTDVVSGKGFVSA